MIVQDLGSTAGASKSERGVKDLVLLVKVDVEVVVDSVVQIFPDEPTNIPSLSAVEVFHLPQSACAKDEAPKNILSMLITLDTSHLEMSLLKDDAEANMFVMSRTLDTSHFEMSLLNDDAL